MQEMMYLGRYKSRQPGCLKTVDLTVIPTRMPQNFDLGIHSHGYQERCNCQAHHLRHRIHTTLEGGLMKLDVNPDGGGIADRFHDASSNLSSRGIKIMLAACGGDMRNGALARIPDTSAVWSTGFDYYRGLAESKVVADSKQNSDIHQIATCRGRGSFRCSITVHYASCTCRTHHGTQPVLAVFLILD